MILFSHRSPRFLDREISQSIGTSVHLMRLWERVGNIFDRGSLNEGGLYQRLKSRARRVHARGL